MAGISSVSEQMDDVFVHTWYEIRAQAIDNILDATPVTAALRSLGCFKTQVGGRYITRTIKYGTKSATDFKKGDTLSSGEDDIETLARWDWKYFGSHVQRSRTDDQVNNGPEMIKKLVETKLTAARDALSQGLETRLLAVHGGTGTAETQSALQSIYWILPGATVEVAAADYYGGITRDNAWWEPATAVDGSSYTAEVDMLDLMETSYNNAGANMEPPKLVLTTQTLFETYAAMATEMSQIIKDASTKLADLGFDVLRFHGKPVVWSANVTAGDVLFLNTDYIDLVYDPSMWFEMTEWKPIPHQLERLSHIVCALNLVCSQLRRQHHLYSLT